MSNENSRLLSPRVHSMNLRVSKGLEEEEHSETEDETGHLLSTGTRGNFASEPQEVVNMGLQQLRTARGTATRRLRTVKKAWGTFKAKAKKHTAVPQPKLRPQQLWSMSLSTPMSPSARALMLNSPLTPDPYATPENVHRYRQKVTPGTPITPLRRSVRIASQTPTPGRDDRGRRAGARRTTPKRIQLNSPGQILRDLNAMTLQTSSLGQRSKPSVSSAVDAFKAMSDGLSHTITKQDSSGKLIDVPIQKPAKKNKSTDAMETKENEPEPGRMVRMRRNRGVVVSHNASDGQGLTENFSIYAGQ